MAPNPLEEDRDRIQSARTGFDNSDFNQKVQEYKDGNTSWTDLLPWLGDWWDEKGGPAAKNVARRFFREPVGNQEDACQDIALKFFRGIQENKYKTSARQPGNPIGWVRTIAWNTCLNLDKKGGRKKTMTGQDLDCFFQSKELSPADEASHKEFKDRVLKLVDRLPEGQRRVVQYKMKKMSEERIADAMGPGWTRDNVKDAWRNALGSLRNMAHVKNFDAEARGE